MHPRGGNGYDSQDGRNPEWGRYASLCSALIRTGYAAKSNDMPLVSLSASPDFTKVAEASRAWTTRVERGDDLLAVLEAAIEHVTVERTQALVEIRIA
jgi:acetolactate synthase-1/2/3 large subunit